MVPRVPGPKPINRPQALMSWVLVDHNYSYYIRPNNVQLEELQSIKDLGVTFDSQLKFDKHIDDKVNKAYRHN